MQDASSPSLPGSGMGAAAAAHDASAVIPCKPTLEFMTAHPARWLALGFGTGLSPIMPGTVGTLFGWLSFAVFSPWLAPIHWMIAIVVGFLLGCWACARTGRAFGVADHGAMVWDEVIAFWLVLLLLTPSGFWTQFWAFVWFRVFDMSKPPPIRRFERRFKKFGLQAGFGVMADDILAAFYTLLVFAIWRAL